MDRPFLLTLGLMSALGLGLAACATRSPAPADPVAAASRQPEALAASWTPAESCAVKPPESGLPAVQELVDSVSLHEEIVRRWSGEEAPWGYLLTSLYLPRHSTSASAGVRGIERNFPRTIQDTLEALVVSHVDDPPQVTRAARLRIELRPDPNFSVEPTELCRPTLRNRREVWNLFTDALFGKNLKRTRSTLVRLHVDREGDVQVVRILSSSGDAEFDRFARALSLQMKFHPATSDGIPVPMWVDHPVTLQVSWGMPPP